MKDSYITVVGAVNIDICGTSSEQLLLYDSNPGTCTTSYGGVGRNIADNLCRLEEKVELITVLGDDLHAKELIEQSEKVGISFKHSLFCKGARTSTFIAINNSDGDMSLAVNDMSIYDRLTTEFISTKMDVINGGRLVVIDTNIPEDVIRYIAENSTVPIMADPVSTKKAMKLHDVMGKLNSIKPNVYEAELLSGMKIDGEDDASRVAKYFTTKGVKNVFISMGSEGVFYSDGKESGMVPAAPGRIVNTNGCGDAFVAAVAHVFCSGGSIKEMATAGVSASAICAESDYTISDQLNCESLRKRMIY